MTSTPYCGSSCCSKGKRLLSTTEEYNSLYTATNAAKATETEKLKIYKQSPVDIITCKSVYNERLEKAPLMINYSAVDLNAVNTGYTAKFHVLDNENNTFVGNMSNVKGGPMDSSHIFKAAEFHFHWNVDNENGSEHFVNGQAHSAELHIVHWNSSLYPTLETAAAGENGLCVIGVLLNVSSNKMAKSAGTSTFGNAEEELIKMVKNIRYKNDSTRAEGFKLRQLLPSDDNKYYTYGGSLTTLPFTENVTWILMKNAVTVSESFVASLRDMRNCTKADSDKTKYPDNAILCNCRPIMPIHSRIVSRSFESE